MPVRDLAGVGIAGARPVRRFSWSTAQRHRPGLQFLVSTGLHHGFESLAERTALLAVDFAADAAVVLAQPFRLRYRTADGWRAHVPDFLVQSRGGARCLIDVRPLGLIRAEDEVAFAAAGEAALVCGWRYLVAAGWRAHVAGVLDALSAQRRAHVAEPWSCTCAAAPGGAYRSLR